MTFALLAIPDEVIIFARKGLWQALFLQLLQMNAMNLYSIEMNINDIGN